MDFLNLWDEIRRQTEALEAALGLSQHAHFLSLVLLVLLSFASLLATFFIFAVASRLARRAIRLDDSRRRRSFAAILSRQPPHVTLGDFDLLSQLFYVIRYQKGEIFFFRRYLVELAEISKNDAERLRLFSFYKGLRFDAMDYRLLRSFFWWRRLSAVIRLESFVQRETVDHLLLKIEDRNDLVAIAALRALSRMKFERKTERILSTLSRRAPARRDVFAEVMTNIGREEIDSLIHFVQECYDPYIASIAIRVLGRLQARQSIPLLRQLLLSADDLVVVESMGALSAMNAEGAFVMIRPMLKHATPAVRRQALESLRSLQDPNWKHFAQAALEDESAEVQRMAFDLVGNDIRYV